VRFGANHPRGSLKSLQNLQSVARRRLTDVAINKALLNKPFGDEPLLLHWVTEFA